MPRRAESGLASDAQVLAACKGVVAETRAACAAGRTRSERVRLWTQKPSGDESGASATVERQLPCTVACGATDGDGHSLPTLYVYGLRLTAVLDADYSLASSARILARHTERLSHCRGAPREEEKKKKGKSQARDKTRAKAAAYAAANFVGPVWGERSAW